MRFCGFLLLGLALLGSSPGLFAVSNNNTPATLPVNELQHFANAINLIKNYYVEPIDYHKLFTDAIRGMLAGLDPHSTYLDEQELKDLQDTTTGEFNGLGMEVMLDEGFIRVISVIDDTPAQKAGIKPDDIIVRINNELVKGMELRDAIIKMRGAPNTTVTLTIFRKRADKLLKIKVTREKIHVESVKSYLMMEGYGYIRIGIFQINTSENLAHEVKKLQHSSHSPLKGVILDLRNNPGGLLESAVDITNSFLDSKALSHNRLIVYTNGRFPATQFVARANGKDILNGIPLVVLINGGSASGAEIVAGALQDYKRAVIVGTPSFGKGSVQTVLPLDSVSALKLTTAFYYTPAGRSIQAKGIEPDVIVQEEPISNKPEADEITQSSLKEADFLGHLTDNEHAKDQVQNNEHTYNAISAKMLEDSQVKQAFNILQGLVAIKAK